MFLLKPEATSTTTTVTISSGVVSITQLNVPISEDLLVRSSLKEPVQTEAPKSQQELVKGKRTKTSNYKLQSEF